MRSRERWFSTCWRRRKRGRRRRLIIADIKSCQSRPSKPLLKIVDPEVAGIGEKQLKWHLRQKFQPQITAQTCLGKDVPSVQHCKKCFKNIVNNFARCQHRAACHSVEVVATSNFGMGAVCGKRDSRAYKEANPPPTYTNPGEWPWVVLILDRKPHVFSPP